MSSVGISVCSDEEDDDDDHAARGICTGCGIVQLPHACSRGRVHIPKQFMSSRTNPDNGLNVHASSSGCSSGGCARDDDYAHMFGLRGAKKPRLNDGKRDGQLSNGIDALRTLLSDHDAREKQLESVSSNLETSQQTTAYFQAELAKEKAAAEKTNGVVDKQTQTIEQKDKKIAEQAKEIAQLKASSESSKKKGKAAAVAAAPATAPGRTAILSLYHTLAAAVIKTYVDKGKRHQSAWTPPPAPPPAPAPPPPPPAPAPGPPVTMILQKNSSPSYLTVREIQFKPTPSSEAAFYFDSGTTPWAPTWTKISDSTTTTALLTLGVTLKNDKAGNVAQWKPTVGTTVQYSFGSHSYDVNVVQQPYPQQPPPPPAPPPPPPQPVYKMPWEHEVLFTGSFQPVSTATLTTYLSTYDFSALPEPANKKDIKGVYTGGAEGKLVAELAQTFSSFAQKFTYCPSSSQLWVKPPWFETVLEAAKTRGYRECRILMHGCRSGDYDKLAADPTGFDIGRSNHGAKKWGFYGACSDHIASDYASYARNNSGALKYPDGTAYIGLLFVKSNAGAGAYEHYNLGSTRPGSLQDRNVCDAFAVRDQCLWLPVGLAMAK
jgi:hypothetical protein